MFYKVNTVKLQIRGGPGTNYADIGDLFSGDVIETAELMGGWHRVVKIMRVGTKFYENPPDVNTSWCSAAYTVEIAAPNPEPTPGPTPEPSIKPLIITITGEDYETAVVTIYPKL